MSEKDKEELSIAEHKGKVYVLGHSLQERLDKTEHALRKHEEWQDARWKALKRVAILGAVGFLAIVLATAIVIKIKWTGIMFVIKKTLEAV